MKNKYQDALDNLFGLEWIHGDERDELTILQELVDKATPKKVKDITNNVLYGDHHSTGYCPNCGVYLDIPSEVWYHFMVETDYFTCGCGQKLDWSEDVDL